MLVCGMSEGGRSLDESSFGTQETESGRWVFCPNISASYQLTRTWALSLHSVQGDHSHTITVLPMGTLFSSWRGQGKVGEGRARSCAGQHDG